MEEYVSCIYNILRNRSFASLAIMVEFQAMYKHFAIFLSLVACHDSLLSAKKVDSSSIIAKEVVSSFGDLIPGHSPGVGHRKYGRERNERSNIKGDVIEAFRPTTPGYSAGAGHSINN
ncbi:hypothetical protein VNO77_25305 [Canavalia gladiata]|uniref:Uncharacterized protein n=1 Tax=Canavalia gladiata TaxID=3824 RepID=A0AAN9L7V8_CANGL